MTTFSDNLLESVTYITNWLYCDNAGYVAAGVSGNVCGTYAFASIGYVAKSVGAMGKAMTMCYANPILGPCFAFSGYSLAHVGQAGYRAFQAYNYCQTDYAGGERDCSSTMIDIVLDAGQAVWYSMIALDYCLVTPEDAGEEAVEQGEFDIQNEDVCSYTDEEIQALAEEYGFDPASINFDDCY